MNERSITIVKYDPAWVDLFEEERLRLRAWISEYTARIEHVGSTSVQGLGAKSIIDITAVVADVDGLWGDLDKLSAALGYELSHIPGDHLFLQRTDKTGQRYNLHLIRQSNDLWKTDLLFREYLRANPGVKEDYEAVKREAAAVHPNDIDAYNEAKGEFCRSVLEHAIADNSISIPDEADK